MAIQRRDAFVSSHFRGGGGLNFSKFREHSSGPHCLEAPLSPSKTETLVQVTVFVRSGPSDIHHVINVIMFKQKFLNEILKLEILTAMNSKVSQETLDNIQTENFWMQDSSSQLWHFYEIWTLLIQISKKTILTSLEICFGTWDLKFWENENYDKATTFPIIDIDSYQGLQFSLELEIRGHWEQRLRILTNQNLRFFLRLPWLWPAAYTCCNCCKFGNSEVSDFLACVFFLLTGEGNGLTGWISRKQSFGKFQEDSVSKFVEECLEIQICQKIAPPCPCTKVSNYS